MNETVSLLLCIYYASQGTLIRCAIKVKRDDLGEHLEYPNEPDCRNLLRSLMPPHIRSIGPIIHVENLFDIHIDQGVNQ